MKVLFLYIPVVHKQVLELLRAHKDSIVWLLDNMEAMKDNVYLERDARALSAQDIKTELEAHGVQNITIVPPGDIEALAKDVEQFVVTEDEVILSLLDAYAKDVPKTIENIFIRWNQTLSTTEFEIPPGRTITSDEFSKEVITELEDEAQKSPDWWRQIAAAVVKGGKMVAVSHNKHYPSANSLAINGDPRSSSDAGKGPAVYSSIHAEAAVIAMCARDGVATKGADIYVTTFPCPTCARSVIEAGFKRMFYKKGYSMLDAEQLLKDEGIEIILVTD